MIQAPSPTELHFPEPQAGLSMKKRLRRVELAIGDSIRATVDLARVG